MARSISHSPERARTVSMRRTWCVTTAKRAPGRATRAASRMMPGYRSLLSSTLPMRWPKGRSAHRASTLRSGRGRRRASQLWSSIRSPYPLAAMFQSAHSSARGSISTPIMVAAGAAAARSMSSVPEPQPGFRKMSRGLGWVSRTMACATAPLSAPSMLQTRQALVASGRGESRMRTSHPVPE